MIYCDTSLFVSVLTGEPASEGVQRWLADRTPGSIAISLWVETEFAAAVARKRWGSHIDADGHSRIMATWRRVAQECHVDAIGPHHFDDAALFLTDMSVRLRAGDALHLAVARRGGHEMATLDRELADACGALGLPVHRFHV